MKQIFTILLCFLSFLTKSQISETFSSSYITAQNPWKGDTGLFYISNEGVLQLDDPYEQGNASVYVPATYSKNMEWELDINLYFNSSNSNNVRLFVIESGPETDEEETRYFIQVGHNDDNISLYSIKGNGTAKRIIKGRADVLNADEATIRVKLVLEGGKRWKLLSRCNKETAYTLEGDTTLSEVNIPSKGIFRINCRYTKTRSYHFEFDNLLISGTSTGTNDIIPPFIKQVDTESASAFLFTFSEPIESSKASCTLDEGGEVRIEAISGKPEQLRVRFSPPLQLDSTYTLCWNNLTDSAGNCMESDCIRFTYTEEAAPENPEEESPSEGEDTASTTDIAPGEIIINEILPDPQTGGSEYIELFNRSGKALSTKKLAIAIRKSDKTLSTRYPLNSINYVLKSEGYLVLSKDKNGVLTYYTTPNPEAIHSLKLPVLANTSSTLVLLHSETEEVIDELSYNSKWHNSFVKEAKGIALERIDPESETQNGANWTSAAADVGHGTPGYKNSQYGNLQDGTIVGIDLPVFIPESNTYSISYKTNQAGYSCRIFIFDPMGKRVAILKNHELIGQNGEIQWDGKNSGGEKLPTGLYILYAELYHPSGILHRFKKVFSVR